MLALPTKFSSMFNMLNLLDSFHVQSDPYQGLDAWWEDEALALSLELPGFEKGKISVVAEEGFITISAASGDETETSKEKKYLVRSPRRKTTRRFVLPDGLDVDKAECDYENGILRIMIPRAGPSKRKEIEVK